MVRARAGGLGSRSQGPPSCSHLRAPARRLDLSECAWPEGFEVRTITERILTYLNYGGPYPFKRQLLVYTVGRARVSAFQRCVAHVSGHCARRYEYSKVSYSLLKPYLAALCTPLRWQSTEQEPQQYQQVNYHGRGTKDKSKSSFSCHGSGKGKTPRLVKKLNIRFTALSTSHEWMLENFFARAYATSNEISCL